MNSTALRTGAVEKKEPEMEPDRAKQIGLFIQRRYPR
jgi:hypothetical protein